MSSNTARWGLGTLLAAGLGYGAAAHAESPADIASAAAPGVVLVLAGDTADGGGSSAGFVVSPEGKILTLAQTVQDPQTQAPYRHIFVYLRPQTVSAQAGSNLMNRYRAQIIASSPPEALDLALLQLEDAPAEMTPLTFGNANQMAAGAGALALGHSEAAGLWSAQMLHVTMRVDNYAHKAGRQTWVLDRGVGFGQWGGPLIDDAGHVQGLVMAPLPGPVSRNAKMKTRARPLPGVALTSTALVGWLAQNNMALAVPGSPPGDDPNSMSDNPTPQPSTVAVVDAVPDAEAARRHATAAAHGSAEPVVVARDGKEKSSLTPVSAGADSFVTARRPYSLRQTHRQQFRTPLGTTKAPDGAPSTAAEPTARPER